jgi:GH24 family phage-related lysozyme (muramidase)
VELVKGFEGFRSAPYQDQGGVWTIGYGSTRDGDGNPVAASTPPVTTDQAEALLARDMGSAADCVDGAVTVELTGNQYAAIISFVYNVGQTAFKLSTMLRLLNAGDISGASAQFPRWNLAGGRVSNGLVTRRATERRLFDTP